MYLPTLFFTLSHYTLNVWTRIARQAPDMIEAVQYIFLASAFTCMVPLNISFPSAQYIFLEITLSLFTAILYVISKKCQRTALGCWRFA